MNLSFAILLMLLPSTRGDIHRPKSIQIIDEDCKEAKDGRCARTLYPPSGTKDPPAETYTCWECGIGSKDSPTNPSCNCGISRVVVQPHSNYVVPIYPGEYLSENACNAQCKRGPENKCWTTCRVLRGGQNYFCQHKADAPFSYLGQSGMVLGGLNGCNRVCPRLAALPYKFNE